MMKRISLLILLAGLSYGQVTNVIATKAVAPFWVVPSATMPLNLWTNSVLWITAQSPVQNSGATNAKWVCYAKNCTGNATQTTIASQPATITTNGVKALSFDGGDYLYTTTNFPIVTTNKLTILGKVSKQSGIDRTIAAVFDGARTNRHWRLFFNDGSLRFLTSSSGSTAVRFSSVDSNNVPTDFSFKLVREGTNVSWEINGAAVDSSGGVEASFYAAPCALTVGASGNSSSGVGFYTGSIYYLQVIVD